MDPKLFELSIMGARYLHSLRVPGSDAAAHAIVSTLKKLLAAEDIGGPVGWIQGLLSDITGEAIVVFPVAMADVLEPVRAALATIEFQHFVSTIRSSLKCVTEAGSKVSADVGSVLKEHAALLEHCVEVVVGEIREWCEKNPLLSEVIYHVLAVLLTVSGQYFLERTILFYALRTLGFGISGPIKGHVVPWLQSRIHDAAVPAGSIFAQAQSFAMKHIPVKAKL